MTGDSARWLELLERLYAEVRRTPRDLRPEDRLDEDLGLDSLAIAELMTALEDELGISLVDDERVPLARTVGDVMELLRTPRAPAPAPPPPRGR